MKSLFFLLMLGLTSMALAQEISISEGAEAVNLNVSLRYQSHWSIDDINRAIDPANGGIQELFKDPISLRKVSGNRYRVSSSIKVMMVGMNFNSLLDYSQVKQGNKTIHQFRFYDFDHLFVSTNIRVEVAPAGNLTAVNIRQSGVIKKSSYGKIKSVPGGPGTFRSRMLGNIRKFRSSTGGQ